MMEYCDFLPVEIGELTTCATCGRRVRYRGRPVYALHLSKSAKTMESPPEVRPAFIARLEKLQKFWELPKTAVARAAARGEVCARCDHRFPQSSRWSQLGCKLIGQKCADKTKWVWLLMADDGRAFPRMCPHAKHVVMGGEPMKFDRVVCVNLSRRPGKWERFQQQLRALQGWPFGDVEQYAAIDGGACGAPPWFHGNLGAWGCYRSHVRILEECLSHRLRSVLIFEDDCEFAEGFCNRVTEFLAAVPDDWGMIYLGGQLLAVGKHPPTVINSQVVRAFNVNRTHAYAVQAPAMAEVYRHLSDGPNWDTRWHVDHYLGKLHAAGKIKVYCPAKWLVWQRPNEKSDVGSRVERWPDPASVAHVTGKVVVVFGLHRSGSSCLAGVLARLGVYFGTRFTGCEPDGGHEDARLAKICEQAAPFPSTKIRVDEKTVRSQLANLVQQLRREQRGATVGVKYPHLLFFAQSLCDTFGTNLIAIHADRPLESSVASLIRREKKRPPEKLKAVQEWLWTAKQRAPDGFHVEYDEMVRSPLDTTRRLARLLGVTDESVISHAAAYVRPELCHVTIDK